MENNKPISHQNQYYNYNNKPKVEPEENTKVEPEELNVKVKADKLNIREDASLKSNIIVEVKKDDILKVVSNEVINDFYKVETEDGKKGYCMIKFVEKI